MSEDRLYGLLITGGFAIIGWFISRIFAEIERSRTNERKLFELINAAEKEQLKQHIEILEDQRDQARKSKNNV